MWTFGCSHTNKQFPAAYNEGKRTARVILWAAKTKKQSQFIKATFQILHNTKISRKSVLLTITIFNILISATDGMNASLEKVLLMLMPVGRVLERFHHN